MRDWFHSFQHLYEHMEGKSFNANTGTLAASNFDDPGTDDKPKGEFYTDKQEMGTNLSPTTFTVATPLSATHSLVKDNFSQMEDQIKQAIQSDVDPLPKETPPPPPSPTDPSPDPAPAKMTQILSSLVKITKEGTKGAQQLKQYTEAKHRYQILFGSQETNSDGETVVKLATLTENGDEMLQATDSVRRAQLLKQGIKDVLDLERRDGTLLGNQSDFNPNIINDAYYTNIKNCHWHTETLNQCATTLDKALSIVQFLPCSPKNKSLVRLITTSDQAYQDDMYEEDDTKKGGMLIVNFDAADLYHMLPIIQK